MSKIALTYMLLEITDLVLYESWNCQYFLDFLM